MNSHLLQNSNTLIPFARHYSGVFKAGSTVAFSNTVLGEPLEEPFTTEGTQQHLFN
jgi:hypothetical protein